jgi:hypothetical protein
MGGVRVTLKSAIFHRNLVISTNCHIYVLKTGGLWATAGVEMQAVIRIT